MGHDMHADLRIEAEKLLDFAASAYAAQGVPEDEARLAADTLVQADLWGHQSHGVMRLSWYVGRLRSGVMRAAAEPRFPGGDRWSLFDGPGARLARRG